MDFIRKYQKIKRKYQVFFTFIKLGLLFYAVYVILMADRRSQEHNLTICLKYVELSVEGIVDTCFIDYKDKGTFNFRLMGEKTYRDFPLLTIENEKEQLEKGDYIKKKKGEKRYIIFKQNKRDSVVFINFECKGLKSGR